MTDLLRESISPFPSGGGFFLQRCGSFFTKVWLAPFWSSKTSNAVNHSVCWSWEISIAVNYSICWSGHASNAVNYSTCWSWEASNAANYYIRWSWNVPMLAINSSICLSWNISKAAIYIYFKRIGAPEDHRARGSSGPLLLWSLGPLVPWSSGPVVLWSRGLLVPWSSGPWSRDQRTKGPEDQGTRATPGPSHLWKKKLDPFPAKHSKAYTHIHQIKGWFPLSFPSSTLNPKP